jgi:hypothetical protein
MDAMLLVAGIGHRFLWCDRFCIIQDDEKHKHEQIENMDQIFGEAILTIAAISGTNSQDPLLGIITGTRRLSSIIQLDGAYAVFSKHPHNDFSHNLAESVYERRGWTFQERLLSRRCLYVTKNGLYYECRTGLYHESSLLTAIPRLPVSETEFQNGSLPLLHRLSNSLDKSNLVNVYQRIVTEYTNRELTFSSDIINAISGVLSHLGHVTTTIFAGGLSAAVFEPTLFWVPRNSLWGRNCQMQGQEERYPSWSWAGWTGCVDFLVAGNHITPTTMDFCLWSRFTFLQIILNLTGRSHAYHVLSTSPDARQVWTLSSQSHVYDAHQLEFLAQVREWDTYLCFGEVKSLDEKDLIVGFWLHDQGGTSRGVLVHPHPVAPQRGDKFILLGKVDPRHIQRKFLGERLWHINDIYIVMLARPSSYNRYERLALGYIYGGDFSNWKQDWGPRELIYLI